MPELRRNGQGNEELIVKDRQQLDLADQEQVRDRRGVEDGPHWPESLRKVSISLSRSSTE